MQVRQGGGRVSLGRCRSTGTLGLLLPATLSATRREQRERSQLAPCTRCPCGLSKAGDSEGAVTQTGLIPLACGRRDGQWRVGRGAAQGLALRGFAYVKGPRGLPLAQGGARTPRRRQRPGCRDRRAAAAARERAQGRGKAMEQHPRATTRAQPFPAAPYGRLDETLSKLRFCARRASRRLRVL